MTQPALAFDPTGTAATERAFPSRRADPAAAPSERRTYLSEVFGLAGFHKVGLVEDRSTGRAWCLQSDEGASLGGTNLAPAPLFHWVAGLHADVASRLVAAAREQGLRLQQVEVSVTQGFASQGSFARGEAVAHVHALDWQVDARGPDGGRAPDLLAAALRSSPAVAAMTTALPGRFALRTNGRDTDLADVLPAWPDAEVEDPLRRHGAMPVPTGEEAARVLRLVPGDGLPEQARERIATHSSPDSAAEPVGFTIEGRGEVDLATGLVTVSTGLPEMTTDRWEITSDPTGQLAPDPLALVALGAAFCYHTQLARYAKVRRLELRNSSLAQLTTYEPAGITAASAGVAHPILTTMFLNGAESEEATRSLLGVAARTCYVHRAMGQVVEVGQRPGHEEGGSR